MQRLLKPRAAQQGGDRPFALSILPRHACCQRRRPPCEEISTTEQKDVSWAERTDFVLRRAPWLLLLTGLQVAGCATPQPELETFLFKCRIKNVLRRSLHANSSDNVGCWVALAHC